MSTREDRGARAEQQLRAARQVLGELELLDRWSAYGDPCVVGSVALELVVRPDIDLEVYAAQPSVRDGFTLVSALAELPKVRSMRYNDARDRDERGLYWKIFYELTPEQTWTIDMWLFRREDHGPSSTLRTAAIRSALTADARDTILAIKEDACAAGQRAHGHWLYRAVLEAHVRTYAEYLSWLGDQDVWERTDWRPSI